MTTRSDTGSTAAVEGTRPADVAVDVDAVAAAVAACRTVAGLSGGPTGTAATYLPGRRVVGVRVDDGTLTVHAVGVYGPTVDTIGTEVRSAVAPLAGGRTVRVVLEDLAVPTGQSPSPSPSGVEASR